MTTNTEPLSTPANDIFLLLVFRLSRLLHRFGSCNGREWELGMNTAMSRAHEAKKNAIVIIVSSCKSALSFKISSHKWQLLSYQTCIKMALALAHIRYAKSEVKTKNHFNRATWGFLLYMIHVRALRATMNNSHIIFFLFCFYFFTCMNKIQQETAERRVERVKRVHLSVVKIENDLCAHTIKRIKSNIMMSVVSLGTFFFLAVSLGAFLKNC